MAQSDEGAEVGADAAGSAGSCDADHQISALQAGAVRLMFNRGVAIRKRAQNFQYPQLFAFAARVLKR
jgi:hypothetical protein